MAYSKSNAIRHIAIIPDGNRRYAKVNSLSLLQCYNKVVDLFFTIIEVVAKMHIHHITFFCLSPQNFARPAHEIIPIFKSLNKVISKILFLDKYLWFKKHCRINIIGESFAAGLSKKIGNTYSKWMQKMNDAIAETTEYQKQNNCETQIILTLAINYGGKEEIRNAVSEAQHDSESAINSFFHSRYLPEIDILIRTGNVMRISNFLLWKLAYAELFFLKCYWPDFTVVQLNKIIKEFETRRQRRFGK